MALSFSILHHIEEDVGGGAGSIRGGNATDMGVIAVIPAFVSEVKDLTRSIEWVTLVGGLT